MKILCGTVAVLIIVGSGVMVYVMVPHKDVLGGPVEIRSSPFGPIGQSEEAKGARARLEVMSLGQQAEVYFVKNGMYPESLDALTVPQPDGAGAMLAADKLFDPWGRPYQYDPAGPRNNGLKPDVFTTAPAGETIGNWPEKK